jgi:hypothetical protein
MSKPEPVAIGADGTAQYAQARVELTGGGSALVVSAFPPAIAETEPDGGWGPAQQAEAMYEAEAGA